jgi:hypothetical protein
MSATNRSDVRHPDDFYETPTWLTEALMPHLRAYLEETGTINPGMKILEPSAGAGAITRVLSENFGPIPVYALDLNPRAEGIGQGDFLEVKPTPGYDLIITNPPYSLAMEFIKHALKFRRDKNSIVAMLLRINFLGSRKRAKWHRRHPTRLHVTPKRPAFTLDGKTDATEYAWFLWREPFDEFSGIVMLDTEDIKTERQKLNDIGRKYRAKLRALVAQRKKEAVMGF